MGLTKLVGVLGTITSLMVTFTALAEICATEKSDNRGSVKFRDSGRTLTVIGHEHGITLEVMSMGRLADDVSSTNEEYLVKALMRLKSFEETLKQYRAEVAELRALIQAKKIDFIALEYGDEIMQAMTMQTRIYLPMTRANLENRGLKPSSIVDDSFLIFAGPAQYLQQTDPELMKNVRIVGVEDDDLMQKGLDLMTDAEDRLQTLAAAVGKNSDIYKFTERAYGRAVLEYDLHKFLEDEWITREVDQKVPASLRSKVMDPIISGFAAAEILRKRDAQSSAKLLAQEGSGVLIIGSAHVRSLTNLIQSACAAGK